jgi:hypothetical protein
MPPDVGAMAAKFGLGWGGNWKSRKDAMHFSAAQSEGGTLLKARNGGMFNGPDSGYLVELHGNEIVAPSEKFRNMIDNMGKADKSELPAEVADLKPSTPSSGSSMDGIDPEIFTDMMSMMEEKFDALIESINAGNDTQDKILRYSKA